VPTDESRVMVEIRNMVKYFGKLKALDNVSLDIYDGGEDGHHRPEKPDLS
jgi:ABC-type sugar transport system ATPase subunit